MIARFAPWPFVGRQRESDAIVAALGDGSCAGVLVLGPAGVGKTRLVDEVAARLVEEGRSVVRAVGATVTEAVPFAAVAHLLGDRTAELAPAEVYASLAAQLDRDAGVGRRAVIVVDDVALLDSSSMTLLAQLVTAGVAALVGTVREGQVLPATLGALEHTRRIARMEIGPFDVDGVLELLEAVQGGTVDRRTGKALWDASQGNLLYLRELVLGSLASGAMVAERGHWRLVAPLRATAKLTEVVSGRLGGLARPARELADALAAVERLRIDTIESLGLGEAALELDAEGLVASELVAGDTIVRLAHPLYGEVLRGQLSPLRRRSLLLRVAEVLEAEGRHDDTLRLAAWLTAAGAPVDPATLREAIRLARTANDFELVAQLARVAVEQHEPDLELLTLLGEACYELNRIDEADQRLAEAAEHVQDDLGRIRLAILHHRVLLWGAHDPDASVAVLEEAAAELAPGTDRGHLDVSIANTLVFHERPGDVLAVIDHLETTDPTVPPIGAHAHALALVRLGDPVRAAEVAATARATTQSLSRYERVTHPGLLMNAEALARVEAGQLAEAEAVATEAYSAVVDQRVPSLHAWLALTLGRVAYQRGQLATARRWWAEALSVAGEIAFAPARRMALGGLAVVAGQLGDVHVAATLLAELDELAPDVAFLRPELALGRAWALVALGRLSEATAALLEESAACRPTGDHLLAAELGYEAARIGGAPAARSALADPLEVTGPLAAARLDHLHGLADGSVRRLLDAEEGFATIGAQLAAAEAAAAAAGLLRAGGRDRDAAAASLRSEEHLRACEGASTPGLSIGVVTASLTPREREVAVLAARGMASKQIARQLGVAERTVSNHLQNAYVKLGISSRADLAAALGTLDGP